MADARTSATLTAGQQARRRRVIDAAVELASEGGYDAVLMRDVSTRADVALGTIYRYFSSKDDLLAAAMADLTAGLHTQVTRVPPKGGSAADRLVDVYRRATRALEREPKMTAALITALSSPDEGVNESSALVRGHIAGMAEEILVTLDPGVRDEIVSILGHVFYSTLTAWANGRQPFDHVMHELEAAIRLLLAPYSQQ